MHRMQFIGSAFHFMALSSSLVGLVSLIGRPNASLCSNLRVATVQLRSVSNVDGLGDRGFHREGFAWDSYNLSALRQDYGDFGTLRQVESSGYQRRIIQDLLGSLRIC